MILTNNNDYSTSEARRALAALLSATIEGEGSSEVPYMPNDGDDGFWVLDLGNDWRLKFHEDKPSCFEITYRYNRGHDQESALAGWLACRIKARVYQPG